jgi:hypothetical protein
MTEREKPDLSRIEPIGKVPDADDESPREQADRVGHAAAAAAGTPPAVGVDAAEEQIPAREPEPRTSPETEDQLEKLRRG